MSIRSEISFSGQAQNCKSRKSFLIDSLLEEKQRRLQAENTKSTSPAAEENSHKLAVPYGKSGMELRAEIAKKELVRDDNSPVVPEEPFCPPTDPSPSSSATSCTHSTVTKPSEGDGITHGEHTSFMELLSKLTKGDASSGEHLVQSEVCILLTT